MLTSKVISPLVKSYKQRMTSIILLPTRANYGAHLLLQRPAQPLQEQQQISPPQGQVVFSHLPVIQHLLQLPAQLPLGRHNQVPEHQHQQQSQNPTIKAIHCPCNYLYPQRTPNSS